MRAVFDTTCDFVAGPSTATPGVVRFTCPCRVVAEYLELPQSIPMSDRLAYITEDTDVPTSPSVSAVGEVYTTDYGMADRVAVPSGNIPIYEVLFVELVIPHLTNPYYRSHVRQIPDLAVLLQEDLYPLLQEDGNLLLLT